MAVTTAGFLAEFPEFTKVNQEFPSFVTTKLTAATRFVSSTVWGDYYDHMVYLKAAHLIASSPRGEQARLSKTSAATVYSEAFEAEIRALPMRGLVI